METKKIILKGQIIELRDSKEFDALFMDNSGCAAQIYVEPSDDNYEDWNFDIETGFGMDYDLTTIFIGEILDKLAEKKVIKVRHSFDCYGENEYTKADAYKLLDAIKELCIDLEENPRSALRKIPVEFFSLLELYGFKGVDVMSFLNKATSEEVLDFLVDNTWVIIEFYTMFHDKLKAILDNTPENCTFAIVGP